MPSEDEIDQEAHEDDPDWIKRLRADAKEAKRLRAENEDLTRNLAVSTAGLGDLSERQRKALLATHDGDLTADELRATATELGFVKAPEPSQEEQVSDAERQAHQRVAAASAGAEPAGQPPSLTAQMNAARASGDRAEFERLLAQSGLVRQDG